MKNGICPKCGGREVFHNPGSILKEDKVTLNDGIWWPRQTSPDKYICVRCGYLEYYVPHAEDLQYVREQWQQVQPRE